MTEERSRIRRVQLTESTASSPDRRSSSMCSSRSLKSPTCIKRQARESCVTLRLEDPEYAAPADDAECWRGCKQSFSSWGNTVVPPMQSVPFNPMEVGAHMGLYSPTGTGFPMYSGMQAHDIGFGPAGFMAEAMSAGRRESVVGSQYLASRPVRFSNLWNSPMTGSPVEQSQYGVMPTVGQQYAQPQQAHMVHSPAYQIPSPAQYTRPHGLGLYPGDARASNPDPMDEFGTSYSQLKNNSHSKVHSRQPYLEATQPGTGPGRRSRSWSHAPSPPHLANDSPRSWPSANKNATCSSLCGHHSLGTKQREACIASCMVDTGAPVEMPRGSAQFVSQSGLVSEQGSPSNTASDFTEAQENYLRAAERYLSSVERRMSAANTDESRYRLSNVQRRLSALIEELQSPDPQNQDDLEQETQESTEDEENQYADTFSAKKSGGGAGGNVTVPRARSVRFTGVNSDPSSGFKYQSATSSAADLSLFDSNRGKWQMHDQEEDEDPTNWAADFTPQMSLPVLIRHHSAGEQQELPSSNKSITRTHQTDSDMYNEFSQLSIPYGSVEHQNAVKEEAQRRAAHVDNRKDCVEALHHQGYQINQGSSSMPHMSDRLYMQVLDSSQNVMQPERVQCLIASASQPPKQRRPRWDEPTSASSGTRTEHTVSPHIVQDTNLLKQMIAEEVKKAILETQKGSSSKETSSFHKRPDKAAQGQQKRSQRHSADMRHSKEAPSASDSEPSSRKGIQEDKGIADNSPQRSLTGLLRESLEQALQHPEDREVFIDPNESVDNVSMLLKSLKAASTNSTQEQDVDNFEPNLDSIHGDLRASLRAALADPLAEGVFQPPVLESIRNAAMLLDNLDRAAGDKEIESSETEASDAFDVDEPTQDSIKDFDEKEKQSVASKLRIALHDLKEGKKRTGSVELSGTDVQFLLKTLEHEGESSFVSTTGPERTASGAKDPYDWVQRSTERKSMPKSPELLEEADKPAMDDPHDQGMSKSATAIVNNLLGSWVESGRNNFNFQVHEQPEQLSLNLFGVRFLKEALQKHMEESEDVQVQKHPDLHMLLNTLEKIELEAEQDGVPNDANIFNIRVVGHHEQPSEDLYAAGLLSPMKQEEQKEILSTWRATDNQQMAQASYMLTKVEIPSPFVSTRPGDVEIISTPASKAHSPDLTTDKSLYQSAFGSSNVNKAKPIDKDLVFQFGEPSKPVSDEPGLKKQRYSPVFGRISLSTSSRESEGERKTESKSREESLETPRSELSAVEDLPRELMPAAALEKRFNLPHYDAAKAETEVERSGSQGERSPQILGSKPKQQADTTPKDVTDLVQLMKKVDPCCPSAFEPCQDCSVESALPPDVDLEEERLEKASSLNQEAQFPMMDGSDRVEQSLMFPSAMKDNLKEPEEWSEAASNNGQDEINVVKNLVDPFDMDEKEKSNEVSKSPVQQIEDMLLAPVNKPPSPVQQLEDILLAPPEQPSPIERLENILLKKGNKYKYESSVASSSTSVTDFSAAERREASLENILHGQEAVLAAPIDGPSPIERLENILTKTGYKYQYQSTSELESTSDFDISDRERMAESLENVFHGQEKEDESGPSPIERIENILYKKGHKYKYESSVASLSESEDEADREKRRVSLENIFHGPAKVAEKQQSLEFFEAPLRTRTTPDEPPEDSSDMPSSDDDHPPRRPVDSLEDMFLKPSTKGSLGDLNNHTAEPVSPEVKPSEAAIESFSRSSPMMPPSSSEAMIGSVNLPAMAQVLHELRDVGEVDIKLPQSSSLELNQFQGQEEEETISASALDANAKPEDLADAFGITPEETTLQSWATQQPHMADKIDPDQLLVARAIFHHLKCLKSNTFCMPEATIKNGDFNTIETNDFVRAVAPASSLFNHSCCPNAAWDFIDGKIVTRVLRPIKKGEQVTVSYGYQFHNYPEEERQKALRDTYCFTCKCEACVNHFKTMPESYGKPLVLKCPSCGTPGLKTSNICSSCGTNAKPWIEALDQSQIEYLAKYQTLNADNFQDAIPVIEQHIMNLDPLVPRDANEYVLPVDTLRKCYLMQGYVHRRS